MTGQMRRLFLSSLVGSTLCLTALGVSVGVSAAETGTMQTLQPSSGWAISRIAASSPGAAPYCAMARKFSDNMILTFARNNKSEISVAVDFQRDALTAGQNYFTVMKPGYSQDRAFNVRPVSSRALVIRMGADQDFFDALSRSEHLSIDLDGEQYAFAMPEMESGLRDMQDCLTSTARLASANPALPTESTQPSSTGSAAEAPTTTPAETRVESTDAVKTSIAPQGIQAPVAPVTSQSMSDMRPGAGDTDHIPTAPPQTASRSFLSGDPLAKGAPQPDIATASIDDPQLQAARARVAYTQSRADAPAASSIAAVDTQTASELGILRAENTGLKDALTQARRDLQDRAAAQGQDAAKTTQMSSKLGQLQHDNDSLRAQLAQTVAQADSANDAAAKAKADRIADRTQFQSAQTDRAQREQQMAALRADNISLKSEIAALHTQLATATADAGERGKLQAASAQMNAQIMQLQADNQHLTQSLAQANATAGENGKLQTASTQLNTRVVELQAENQRLTQMLTQANASVGDKDSRLQTASAQMNAQVAQLQTDNQRLTQALAQANAAADQNGKTQIASAQLNTRVTELQSENQRLTQMLAQANAAAGEAGRMQTASAQTNAQVVQLQAENLRLTQALTQAQMDPGGAPTESADNGGKAGQAQLAAVKAERDQLKLSLGDAQTQIAQMQKQMASAAIPVPNNSGPVSAKTADAASDADMAIQMAKVPPASGGPMPLMADRIVTADADTGADFGDASSLQSMLDSAGVHTTRAVKSVPAASSADRKAMIWQIGMLNGSAEERRIDTPGAFDSYVKNYIDKTSNRCHGQFAAEAGAVHLAGSVRTMNYEIACVPQQGAGLSASLLFTAKDGVFTTIAHEGGVDSMDQAMNIRDRIGASLTGTKVASR